MRRGYTLVEIVVALFLGSLVLLAAAQAVRYSSLLLTRVQAHYLAQSGGQLGVTRFSEDVRLADPHVITIYSSTTTPLSGPNGDAVPLAVALRPKDASGTGMAKSPSLAAAFIVYFYDQTTSQWLRGQWTKAGPDDPVRGNDNRTNLPPTGGTLPNQPSITTLLTSPVHTPSGLDFPPQVLTRNVAAMSVTPALWPASPYDLTQGVAISLTIKYDYTNAAAGLQSIESSFTKTFVTCAYPRNHV